MAYESGCAAAPRVNLFSNPDMEYAGKSQGTSTANNARVIQESVVCKGMGVKVKTFGFPCGILDRFFFKRAAW